MQSDYFIYVNLGQLLHKDSQIYRWKVCRLCQPIHYDPNRVMFLQSTW